MDRSAASTGLALDPTLDAVSMRAAFRQYGRIHIPAFLTAESARSLHATLAGETLWMCSTTGQGTPVDVPVEMLEALPPAEQMKFIELAHAEARQGFHYMFDNVRIADALDRGDEVAPAYRRALAFLNGPEFMGFIRTLTGDDRPSCADAQATRYMPGHYLTRHDDRVPKISRLYAYVLNLTPDWKPDWGGLLTFIDDDGHVAEAYQPTFNALNLFRVPQAHAVSFVTPFAGGARLSITGWIRDDRPPFSPALD